MPAQEAADRSIGMLECGPAAGVTGSRVLGELLGQSDVITTDMGGTTFKVSVIQNGEIEYARTDGRPALHAAEDRSSVDRFGRRLDRVAGRRHPIRASDHARQARGPGRSATVGRLEPTLTDVFMLIGYMDPNIFLGGTCDSIRLMRVASSTRRSRGRWA